LVCPPMTVVFSGIQPSGDTHIGNYLGAIRQWTIDQHEHHSYYCVVDLHSLTLPHDPFALRDKTLGMATMLVASGLDPDICTIFVQSHVAEHARLAWLLECTASIGELQRMTQFKDKSARNTGEFISAGLLTYPTLMAADILLYDTNRVPVGDDQRQHIELTRDVAIRFNSRYGDTFVVPEAAIPKAGARVMDLQEPRSKMSKSVDSPQGTVMVLDPPEVIERKVSRAVTDSDGEVRFDVAGKPGVSNLLSILAASTGEQVDALATRYSQYGPLKKDTAAALIEALRPVRERYEALSADPGAMAEVLRKGASKARDVASATYDRARTAIGLLEG
ncbi:MAG TPA: tryptophan--tRNA ligase, partial [Acidimicrobiales bacterium]|nr:tryptophan--tRNA ligase [Acidimicrobiales bacterium]